MQDLNDKVTGGTLLATEWNQVPSEIQNVIEGLGITLSGGDLDQLGQAIAGSVANGTFYTDSGVADAYVLTTIGSKQSVKDYTDGMTVEFIIGNTNTGSSTVNVATLGVKNIADASSGGELVAGDRVILKFRSGADNFAIFGPSKGTIQTVTFTANGTYNPSPNTRAIKFVSTAGGGGGGGVDGQGAGAIAQSAAGSGGSTAMLSTVDIEASYAMVVGAGGAGGAAGANVGTVGGVTSITSSMVTISCPGGLGGPGQLGSAANSISVGANSPAIATGGQINFIGGASGNRIRISGNAANQSYGGESFWGGASRPASSNGVGSNNLSIGCGGGAAYSKDSASDFAGGDGSDGIIVVTEYF